MLNHASHTVQSIVHLVFAMGICLSSAHAHAQLDSLIRSALNEGPVYGTRCGMVGAEPRPRIQIEELIAERNVAVIGVWLEQENAAIRAYAAEALIRLEKAGLPIPEDKRQAVAAMRRSQEQVWTCSGCLYGYETMSQALAFTTRFAGR